MSLWTNRDQTVLHCHNCGVELTDDVEQITIGEFIKKLIVLGIGFGICSMLAYFMINVSCSEHEIPRLTVSVLSLDAIWQPKRPRTSFCSGVCYIFRKESIMKIKLRLYSMWRERERLKFIYKSWCCEAPAGGIVIGSCSTWFCLIELVVEFIPSSTLGKAFGQKIGATNEIR